MESFHCETCGMNWRFCKCDKVVKPGMADLLPCPFCGAEPKRHIADDILHVRCPNCVSVGFHNHVRLGCWADAEWNKRTI